MALVTLEEAKRQLNLTTDREDVELQTYIDALPGVIEGLVGVVEPRSITDQLPGGVAALSVLHPPVLEVTALSGAGTTYDVADLVVDGGAGVITRTNGVFRGGPYTVTYTAGRSEIPPTIKLAALILLQHLWRTQRAARGGVAGGGDDFSVSDPVPGWGYAVPHRVRQLLDAYLLPPGVA
jgi:hypothetical protein